MPNFYLSAEKVGNAVGNFSTNKHLSTNLDDGDPFYFMSYQNEIVLLSLHTISTLSIPTINLIPIIQQHILPYLISSDFRVRQASAITCCKMIITYIGTLTSNKGPSVSVVDSIIKQLLEVVVSDINQDVRLSVLNSFSHVFYRYLSRSSYIETILLLLADEMFEIKISALELLGRLAEFNPSVVLPHIRIQLIRIVSEMQSCPEFKSIEEATLLLSRILRFSSFHSTVKPFVQTLIVSLPLNADVRVVTAALEAFGEMSTVLRVEIVPFIDFMLPVIISNVLDSSSYKKQETAIKTLGQLINSTGLVVRYLR
jgi:FKBP12-rapamycin complex-associated protein